MGRFLFGFIVGGATVYFSLHYHVLRAGDGMHFVPKVTSTFSQTYVDIRGFGVGDWAEQEHLNLVMAIRKAEKTELLRQAAAESISNTVEGMLDSTLGNQR